MRIFKFSFLVIAFTFSVLSGHAFAEDKVKAEDLVDQSVVGNEAADLATIRKGRLTEEQVVKQLKYMMVKGWTRIEKDLLAEGGFDPIGMVLSPNGEFRPLVVNTDDAGQMGAEFELTAIARNLEEIAKQRQVWAVGLMYIQEQPNDDGSVTKRIMVLTEHIAGWARHWSYPFKVVDGEVKLAQPVETSIAPFYFKR